ncbi:MAG TPA: C1 family peptidase [Vicinamibacterales bacterium]|nr:C1 family peptidase [Vicinamibacterales bacterium]
MSSSVIVHGRVLNHRRDDVHTIKAARDAGPLLRAMAAPFIAGLALAWIQQIVDQLQLGACTGNSTAVNLEAALARAGVPNPARVARLWLYWLGRVFDHDTGDDAGAQIGNVWLGAEMYGIAPETVWPYDITTFRGPPPPECYRAAYDFKPQGHRLNSTGDQLLEDITTALGQGRLVTFGSAVSNAYCSNSFDATVPLQAPTGADIAGLHAQNVADRNPDGSFKVANNWGTNWGGPAGKFPGGFSTYSVDYMLDSNTSDLWVCDLVPSTNIVDPPAPGGAS